MNVFTLFFASEWGTVDFSILYIPVHLLKKKKYIYKFIRKVKINTTEMNIWNKDLLFSIIY